MEVARNCDVGATLAPLKYRVLRWRYKNMRLCLFFLCRTTWQLHEMCI